MKSLSTIILVLISLLLTLTSAVRVSQFTKGKLKDPGQGSKVKPIVNGESIDGQIKQQNNIRYNTEFQVVPSEVSQLFTTLDEPVLRMTDD